MTEVKTAIGLMSGTSMDGIDVALLKTDGEGVIEFGPSLAIEYPEAFRKNVERGLEDALGIASRDDRPGDLSQLEKEVTSWHVVAVKQFIKKYSLDIDNIDVIGFHGQTILHRPNKFLTVQLGLGKQLADETGIDVVYDMRAADMLAGGQGAPLVPVFHWALAKNMECKSPVCFVNIGGISNITYVGDELLAFDTGPGNALIDQWVQAKGGVAYDAGGGLASKGRIIPAIVDQFLASKFFKQPGPKSLDRNDFPPLGSEGASLEDGARTLARVTAVSIMESVKHLPKNAPPKTWVVCGGGRLNAVIMGDLKDLAAIQGGKVISGEELNLQGDMLEAQAFAYLAVRSMKGLPLTYPTTTGCKEPVSGGVFVSAQ